MTDLWYPLDGIPQHGRVHCWVHWRGRQFRAARIVDERKNKPRTLVWATLKDGVPQYLPPHGQEEEWGAEPDAFRPIDPKKWDWPLPAPLEARAGIMTAERVRFALVDEAEAADLAKEMEADRANANSVSRDVSRGTGHATICWWRDQSQINYREVPPNLTLRSIEGRLMRAVYHCGAGSHAKFNTSSVLRDLGEAAAREMAEREAVAVPDFVPRMESTPADEGDFLTAMGWFAALNPPADPFSPARTSRGYKLSRAQKIVLRRAKNIPPSYDEIGVEFEITGTRVKQLFTSTIDAVWRLAMGLQRRDASGRGNAMGELRERNRRAKREARA
jgi:hypothetical protein